MAEEIAGIMVFGGFSKSCQMNGRRYCILIDRIIMINPEKNPGNPVYCHLLWRAEK